MSKTEQRLAEIYSYYLDDRFVEDISDTFAEWLATSIYANEATELCANLHKNAIAEQAASANSPERARHRIIINGMEIVVLGQRITFEEVALAAYGDILRPLTIQYTRGGSKPAGVLTRGRSVEVVDGMVFDAAVTTSA